MATNYSSMPLYSPITGYGTKSGDYYYSQTSPSGGTWSTTPATIPGGDVLGAATTATGGGNPPPNPEPTGGGGDGGPDISAQINAEIDRIFNPALSFYGQQEQVARELQPQIESQIGAQYGTSKTALEGEKALGEQQLAQTGQETLNRKEDASAQARRLYSELQAGGRQRFGGASSAGQAYSELTNVEQQRQQGNIQQKYQEAMGKIDGYKQELELKFTTALAELENQKNAAMLEAQQGFQDRLAEIGRAKAQTESDKAMARQQELQNLRNMVYQINLQDYQYKQTLAANKQASEAAVEQARQRAMQYVSGGTTTYQNFVAATPTPTNNLAMAAGPGVSSTPITGIRRKEDELA